jgi:hypothetical protein
MPNDSLWDRYQVYVLAMIALGRSYDDYDTWLNR